MHHCGVCSRSQSGRGRCGADVYDVYLSDNDRVRVVDFNPVGGATATLLFDGWADLGYRLLPPATAADDADAVEAAGAHLESTHVSPDDASCGSGGPVVGGPPRATSTPDATGLQNGDVHGRGDVQQNGHAALPKPQEVRRSGLYIFACHSASQHVSSLSSLHHLNRTRCTCFAASAF